MDLSKYQKLEIGDYDSIFRFINKCYVEYCNTWIQQSNIKLNLKKLQIKDIYNPENNLNSKLALEFEKYMYDFRDGLYDLYFKVLVEGEEYIKLSSKAKFIGRVKTQESLMDKILRKMNDHGGEFPINKYLNDLLGFRIIDPYYKENIGSVINLLNDYKKEKIQVTHKHRCNNGYEGYHIYLKSGNNSFPIEIQLWDMENENKNIKLHSVYKQQYLESIISDYNKF